MGERVDIPIAHSLVCRACTSKKRCNWLKESNLSPVVNLVARGGKQPRLKLPSVTDCEGKGERHGHPDCPCLGVQGVHIQKKSLYCLYEKVGGVPRR